MLKIFVKENKKFKENLMRIVERSKKEKKTSDDDDDHRKVVSAANAITILIAANVPFSNMDLKGIACFVWGFN